jgi:hypothetical protein
MSGSLVQLSAIGAQDAYLTLDPQITFFKQEPKRHTPFAIEPYAVSIPGGATLGKPCTITVQRVADLVHKMWFKLTLPALNPDNKYPGARYCDEVGFAVIDSIELKIGSHTIDKHYGHFLQAWNQLNCPEEKRFLDHLVGKTGGDVSKLEDLATQPQELWIPLEFWFNRTIGNALPIAGLQFHTVEIVVTLKSMKDIVYSAGAGRDRDLTASALQNADINAEMMCHYIYLDDQERNYFGTAPQEYVIDQLTYVTKQIPGSDAPYTDTLLMTLNHPCKEFIWTITTNAALAANEPFCLGALNKSYNYAGDPLISANIKFNELPRVKDMNATYYREIVPALHHTSIPRKNVYCYCFALDPESWKPSGSINLSRIDQVKLTFTVVPLNKVHHPGRGVNATTGAPITTDGGVINLYARVVNVFKVMSGMAGIQYCN